MGVDFRITPVYDTLLRGNKAVPYGLYHLHLLKLDQITRLYYTAGSSKYVQRHLKELVEHGYLQIDATPIRFDQPDNKVYYAPLYYYALGTAGMRYIQQLGLDVHDSFRASKEVNKHSIFLEHTFELNDVLIAAAKLHQSDPRYELERLQHDRLLKQNPILVKVRGKPIKLIPDAHLYIGFQGKHLPLCIEHDRSTEEEQHFRRRIRVYIEGIKSGVIQERFSVRKMTVAFTTFVSEHRLQKMRQWTAEELRSTKEPDDIAATFSFAHLPKAPTASQAWLEPCWYLVGNYAPHALLAA